MADEDRARLAAAIRARRNELGAPRQADMAANAGVSETTWNMAETGKAVGERSLVKMAKVLGWTATSPADVLDGQDPTLVEDVQRAIVSALQSPADTTDYNSRLARMPDHVLQAVNDIIDAEERRRGLS